MPTKVPSQCDPANHGINDSEANANSRDFSFVVGGQLSSVREALSKIRDALASSDCSDEFIGRVEIVLAEIMNNVVEHAFAKGGGSHIDLSGTRDQYYWQFQICDNGRPMPDLELPAGELPTLQTDIEYTPEGGFGWAIVRDLTNEIHYSRQPGRNCLAFSIPLN